MRLIKDSQFEGEDLQPLQPAGVVPKNDNDDISDIVNPSVKSSVKSVKFFINNNDVAGLQKACRDNEDRSNYCESNFEISGNCWPRRCFYNPTIQHTADIESYQI